MREKRYPPIIVSIVLSILGVTGIIIMYNHWNSEEISISNPIISKVTTNSSQQLDLKSIIHEAEKNVIQIEGQNESNTTTGSGFLYNEKGDIITNAHVIKDADVIYVRTANTRIYPLQ